MKLKNAVSIALLVLNILALWMPLSWRAVVIIITTMVLFSMEITSPVASSLIILVLLLMYFPAVNLHDMFSGFRSPVIFFLLATTIMGTALSRSSIAMLLYKFLSSWLARRLPAFLLVVLIMFPMALLIPSSITRNAMLYPVLKNFMDLEEMKKEARDILLVLGMLNPLASSAFLTGGLAPMISSDLLGGFNWWQWFILMGIPYLTLILAGVIYLLIRCQKEEAAKGYETFCKEFKVKKISFAKDDYILIGIMTLVMLLWATDFWHNFHPVVPALLGLVLILIFHAPTKWSEVQQSNALDNMIILGVLFSLISIVERHGFIDQFSQYVAEHFPRYMPVQSSLMVIIVLTAVFHLFIPNISACLTILVPLFFKISSLVGINPIVVGLIVTMTVDTLNFYPAQSTPLLMVYDGTYLKSGDILKFGVGMSLIFIFILFLIILPYWNLLGLTLRV
ncbi:SLC13 family permease [Desulfofundulus kuznetsovii]